MASALGSPGRIAVRARYECICFTDWIWEKPLLAGTPFVLNHLRGREKSCCSVPICICTMVQVIASNSTHSLRQNSQILIIGLAHAHAKCARLSFLSGRDRKPHMPRKETGYEARLLQQ